MKAVRPARKNSPGLYSEWGRTYLIDGVAYPSITTVLGVIHVPRLQKWRLSKAVERGWEGSQKGYTLSQTQAAEKRFFPKQSSLATEFGTAVHAHIEAELKGEIPEPDHDGRRSKHVASAMRFLLDINAEPTMVEQGLYHSQHGYAGTTDLYCRLPDGREIVVDWKTGRSWPRHALQAVACAAADRLLIREAGYDDCQDGGEAPQVDTTFMVYTGENGYQYKEIAVNDPTALPMWESALNLFHAVNSPAYDQMADYGGRI